MINWTHNKNTGIKATIEFLNQQLTRYIDMALQLDTIFDYTNHLRAGYNKADDNIIDFFNPRVKSNPTTKALSHLNAYAKMKDTFEYLQILKGLVGPKTTYFPYKDIFQSNSKNDNLKQCLENFNGGINKRLDEIAEIYNVLWNLKSDADLSIFLDLWDFFMTVKEIYGNGDFRFKQTYVIDRLGQVHMTRNH